MNENKLWLVFDKQASLQVVIILSENFEGLQVKMRFSKKKGKVSLETFTWEGDYIPKGDPNWVPARFYDPAIRQARAIFSEYPKKEKKEKGESTDSFFSSQARLFD